MELVRSHVACGDIGCGRLIFVCSSRDALLSNAISRCSPWSMSSAFERCLVSSYFRILKVPCKDCIARSSDNVRGTISFTMHMVPSLPLTFNQTSCSRYFLRAHVFMLHGCVAKRKALNMCRVRASRNGVHVTKRSLIICVVFMMIFDVSRFITSAEVPLGLLWPCHIQKYMYVTCRSNS